VETPFLKAEQALFVDPEEDIQIPRTTVSNHNFTNEVKGEWTNVSFYSRGELVVLKYKNKGLPVSNTLLQLAFGAQVRNDRYVIGSEESDPSIPIWVSSLIHSAAALLYFNGMAAMNTWYSYNIMSQPAGLGIFIASIITNSILVAFFLVQGIIFVNAQRSERTNKPPDPYSKYYYAASFFLEFVLVVFVTMVSLMASIKRNPGIHWLN